MIKKIEEDNLRLIVAWAKWANCRELKDNKKDVKCTFCISPVM